MYGLYRTRSHTHVAAAHVSFSLLDVLYRSHWSFTARRVVREGAGDWGEAMAFIR